MELDELKSDWEAAGSQSKSQGELSQMTKINGHPQLRRIRAKLIIEALLIVVVLLIHNDAFDGQDKPVWVNVLVVFGILAHLINGVISFISTLNPVKGDNLVISVERFSERLRRLSVSSVLSALVFGASLIVFFGVGVDLTGTKQFIIGGMGITLLIMTYLSFKQWSSRIDHFRKLKVELLAEK